MFTEFRPTVPELFAVGKKTLVFHDFDDLVEQATRLLSEPGLTARLGDSAAQRAHRDHSPSRHRKRKCWPPQPL